MGKFDILTKYIPLIPSDSYGEWIINHENDGTPEHPKTFPYVEHSEMVSNFIDDVYSFMKENKKEWNNKPLDIADVETLEAKYVLAMIMYALRIDRFVDDVLISYFEDGCILKWLERLKTIE